MAREIPFETAMQQLEEITRNLERGELGLEESLKKFDEGMKLVAQCSRQLDQARQKVRIITEKSGSLTVSPYSHDRKCEDGTEGLS